MDVMKATEVMRAMDVMQTDRARAQAARRARTDSKAKEGLVE